MTKYKLLKDLPLAKAGEIVSINEQNRKKRLNEIAIMGEKGTIAYVHKDNIGAWIEEIKKPKSVWNLQIGDNFYFLDSQGDVIESVWMDNFMDGASRLNGNIFLTRKEAEKERDKRQAIAKIQRYCYENNIDNSWRYNNCYRPYYFFFDIEEKQIDITHVIWAKNYNPVGFFSYDDAKKILEKFPKELKLIYS